MKDTPTKKIALILVITCILWIASGFIRGVSEERRGRHNEVLAEIGATLAPDQKLETPYIMLPYTEAYSTEKGKVVQSEKSKSFKPVKADLTGDIKVEKRSRGIYHTQTYGARIDGKLKFELPPLGEAMPASSYPGGQVKAGKPWIRIPLSQKKGLLKFPEIRIAGFDKIGKPYGCTEGICFDVNATYEELRAALREMEISVQLQGMEELSFETYVPEASLRLTSNWPSPSFRGAHLPVQRDVNEKGFTAEWKLVSLGVTEKNAFGVRFIEPVDIYTLTDRASKYALLFIVSVFAAFFLVEAVSKLRLHPLQYALVGAALVVFYLLVTSLSEHISFGLAYVASAVASTALIWYYLHAVMKDSRRSGFMGISIAGQYGMLFVIISAEDYSLLFGSILVFALLAAIMTATRKLDWYALEVPGTVSAVKS